MNRMAWRWVLAASGLALAIAACSATSDDDGDGAQAGGEGGGTSGTGGATGGSGGSTGGSGGSTGGSGGLTGGSGGSTGGSGGGGTTCAAPLDLAEPCGKCLQQKCCTEAEACAKDTKVCWPSFDCLWECEEEYVVCNSTCNPKGNTVYNAIAACMEGKCPVECE